MWIDAVYPVGYNLMNTILCVCNVPLRLGLTTLAYCFGGLKGRVEDASDMPGDLMDDFEWEDGTDFGQSEWFGLGGAEMPCSNSFAGLERHWALATTDPPWVVHAQQRVSQSGDEISNAEANITVLYFLSIPVHNIVLL